MNSHRTRIKICGIREPDDARFAAAAGADAIGLVFHRASPRYVTFDAAASIARAVPAFVTVVGLFVDPAPEDVRRALDTAPLTMLQFHGDETPAMCAQFGLPFLKALRVRPEIDLLQFSARYEDAAAILVDAYRPGVPGGTGETFDWGLIPAQRPGHLVLSGGLTPGNVGDAIERVRPWAVDVSSGVESAPGIKDHERIARFIAAARNADRRMEETRRNEARK